MEGKREAMMTIDPGAPQEGVVTIQRAENGYMIHVQHKRSPAEGMGVFNDLMGAFTGGEDPGAALKKVMSKQQIKESTRRKPVETYVAKNIEELMKILLEVFKGMEQEEGPK